MELNWVALASKLWYPRIKLQPLVQIKNILGVFPLITEIKTMPSLMFLMSPVSLIRQQLIIGTVQMILSNRYTLTDYTLIYGGFLIEPYIVLYNANF